MSRSRPCIITKKHMSRRTILRGAGVALAAAVSRGDGSGADAAGPDGRRAEAPRFLGLVSRARLGAVPIGTTATRRRWRRRAGRNTGSRVHPRAARAVSGSADDRRRPRRDVVDAARRAPPAATTRASPPSLTGAPPQPDRHPSRGQRRSAHRAEVRPGRPAAVAAGRHRGSGSNTGVCGWGYSCAYTNSISWAGAAKPLPHEINPQVVFERLYGDGASPEQRLARKKASASILDRVMGRIADVNKTPGRLRSLAAQRLPGERP